MKYKNKENNNEYDFKEIRGYNEQGNSYMIFKDEKEYDELMNKFPDIREFDFMVHVLTLNNKEIEVSDKDLVNEYELII